MSNNTLHIWHRPDSRLIWLRGIVAGKPYAKSTGTACPKQAEEILVQRRAELFREAVYGTKAVATFAQAVSQFVEDRVEQGRPLSDRAKARLTKLVKHFGETKLADIGQHSLSGAYKACLEPGAGPGGRLRGVFAPLRAVLRNAARHKWCDNPALQGPSVPPSQTHAMKPAEVDRLVAAAPAHARPLFVFLFAIGQRSSEAIDLEWQRDIDLRGRRAVLRQKQRAKPTRVADLPPVALSALKALPWREGAVFRPDKRGHKAPKPGEWAGYRRGREAGKGGQFKKLWANACRNAGLPGRWREWTTEACKPMREFVPDYTPHDARHSWASWHYLLNRDLLKLRDDGGWLTTQMVERYAKVMSNAYRAEVRRWFARDAAAWFAELAAADAKAAAAAKTAAKERRKAA